MERTTIGMTNFNELLDNLSAGKVKNYRGDDDTVRIGITASTGFGQRRRSGPISSVRPWCC